MMMRAMPLGLLLLLLLCGTESSAQSLLWRIDVPGVERPSWIFGTMHARCAQDVLLPDAVQSALREADRLVLEIDLDDPALPATLGKLAFVPADSTLEKLLPASAYDSLAHFLKDSLTVSIATFKSMRPMFLIGLFIGRALECTPVSYEDRLMSIAKLIGKDVVGIETVEEQFAAFSTIPLHAQADMVMAMLRNMSAQREELRKLDAAYAAADLDAVLALIRDSDVEYGRYDGPLLNERNARWIPRILEHARSSSVLLAVGAGHLPGEHGVLQLLRAQGCTVTPVP